ncbi:unnamed protein product [Protopolystoma xenopodis]|uniref:Uncharacterized protein n=1 Tax=Protopolystoma xenopodis TaxID=117903 RepID=A0A448WTL2_9PLAT|nr:unnamed protein product [Protopolystoma xenopodis]
MWRNEQSTGCWKSLVFAAKVHSSYNRFKDLELCPPAFRLDPTSVSARPYRKASQAVADGGEQLSGTCLASFGSQSVSDR